MASDSRIGGTAQEFWGALEAALDADVHGGGRACDRSSYRYGRRRQLRCCRRTALRAVQELSQGDGDHHPALTTAFQEHLVYINVHTAKDPNGEIRGQVAVG